MLFSTNSATALSGFVWDLAMMVIAFQLSPIRSLPVLPLFLCRKFSSRFHLSFYFL